MPILLSIYARQFGALIHLDRCFKRLLKLWQLCRKDVKKARAVVGKEIEIYRDTLKVAKTFAPDDLEDMSLLKKVQEQGKS